MKVNLGDRSHAKSEFLKLLVHAMVVTANRVTRVVVDKNNAKQSKLMRHRLCKQGGALTLVQLESNSHAASSSGGRT